MRGLVLATRGCSGFRLPTTWAGRALHLGVKTVRANYLKKSKAASQVERTRVLTALGEHRLLESNANRLAAPSVLASAAAKEPIAAAAIFEQHGLVRVDGVLLPEECAALREHVDTLLLSSIESVGSTETDFLQLFGPVMCRTARYDVLLPMDATVRSAVQQVMAQAAPVIRELAGAKASLCELSALVSDPGSVPQPVHHDTALFEEYSRKRVSMLVALQDIDENMGPTGEWEQFYYCVFRTYIPPIHYSVLLCYTVPYFSIVPTHQHARMAPCLAVARKEVHGATGG